MPVKLSPISTKRRIGSSIVELMLVFPLLMTLGFGIIEYSSFIYAKSAVQTAAREGGANRHWVNRDQCHRPDHH